MITNKPGRPSKHKQTLRELILEVKVDVKPVNTRLDNFETSVKTDIAEIKTRLENLETRFDTVIKLNNMKTE